ncbi:histidinol dehydrogenase [Microbacterium sp. NPDC055903]
MRTWISRILSWIAAALVGGVFGIAGTIGHSLVWGWVPVGIIVGLIACGAILIAIRSLTHDRGATLAAGLGMLGMVTVISGVGPGGSIVVENTVWGQIWIYALAGIALLTIAWPNLPARKTGPAPVAAVPTGEQTPLITEVPRA